MNDLAQIPWRRGQPPGPVDDGAVESSWLIRDGMDRDRMLDMDRRIRPARRRSFSVLGLALLASGPWLGWWTMAPLATAAVLFAIADKWMGGMRRPEYMMFGAWAGSEVIIAASLALTGGPKAATISWLAIPIVTLASRFSARGIVAGVSLALALLLAVGFGTDADAVLNDPTLVISPAALIIAVTLLSVALMQSDVEFRTRAVIDELTGMLNRTALVTRVSELAQQSRITGESVGVIVIDVDHFKEVNDSRGHAFGDAVLRQVAYAIRKQLRAYDMTYRLGGEEFLVLLAGAGPAETEAVAEQLRAAVAAIEFPGGGAVTISCGVSASEHDSVFDYQTVFAAADRALYAAKRGGRNAVRGAGGDAPALAAA